MEQQNLRKKILNKNKIEDEFCGCNYEGKDCQEIDGKLIHKICQKTIACTHLSEPNHAAKEINTFVFRPLCRFHHPTSEEMPLHPSYYDDSIS